MHNTPNTLKTAIVGILNVTPDSFSDGGKYHAAASALEYAEQMMEAGAHVIDVGAESTRPGAVPLTADEEWQRLAPILPALVDAARGTHTKISVDTRHAPTAEKALERGVDWINDVGGLRDAAMLNALAGSSAPIVFMHALTLPADPNVVVDEKQDIIAALKEFVADTLERAEKHGIRKDRLIFDPGIGFSKTAMQSLEILRRVGELQALGVKLLIGHSRKSFLSLVTRAPAAERDALTLAVSAYLLEKRVDYLRVHDVTRHMELLTLHSLLHASPPGH